MSSDAPQDRVQELGDRIDRLAQRVEGLEVRVDQLAQALAATRGQDITSRIPFGRRSMKSSTFETSPRGGRDRLEPASCPRSPTHRSRSSVTRSSRQQASPAARGRPPR